MIAHLKFMFFFWYTVRDCDKSNGRFNLIATIFFCREILATTAAFLFFIQCMVCHCMEANSWDCICFSSIIFLGTMMWLLENHSFFLLPSKKTASWHIEITYSTVAWGGLCKSITWWCILVTEINGRTSNGGFKKVCFVGQINSFWCGQQSLSCIH